MASSRRNLILASVLYLVSAGTGTAVALAEHLPARFGGILIGNDVLADFLTLNGTALSAPLFMLVIQAVLTVLLFAQGRAQTAAITGLTLLGALYTIGQLGEPLLYKTLSASGFDPLVAAILLANIVFSLLMVVFGVAVWREGSGIRG